jgi:N-acetylneuraminic acid mutarotase
MVRYKMVGRDVNSSPLQFRTWIVNDTPDYAQQHFTGHKSGPDPLVDVSSYIIYDDTVVADFNLPLPTKWKSTLRVLPQSLPYSHVAIVDDFVYLFGGQITDHIFRASLNKPADWIDTGVTLPTPLYGGQLAIIGDRIYIFGGNNTEATDEIFSAPTSDPLNWTNHGHLLPQTLHKSQLAIVDGYIYLFGGVQHFSHATARIFKASTDDPLTWTDTGANLPFAMYSSQVAVIDGYIYLFGGQTTPNTPMDNILRASTSDPLTWADYAFLPYALAGGQFFTVGNKGYLITPIAPGRNYVPIPGVDPPLEKVIIPGFGPAGGSININTGAARILRCDLATPYGWIDTLQQVPGEISQSQLAIIYDRLFLFGGSGSSVIFANSYEIKYKFGSVAAVTYGDITRVQYHSTPNKLDLFRVLGFPPWKTDYGA